MASEQLEIERLLADICDEGATAERIARLQALLYDHPDLQEYYARVIGLHTLLKFELDLSAHRFAPLVDAECTPAEFANGRSRTHKLPGQRVWLHLVTAAAAAAAAILVSSFWLRDESSPPITLASREDLAAAKVETLAVLRDLTQTAVSDLTLPARSAVDATLSLCSGAVWMERAPGQRERGFLVEVPPGAAIDLVIDADAGVHNALSIVELDAAGRPTGGVLSFNNDKTVALDQAPVGGGLIADWSERNNTFAARYYLFTGTHKPQKSTGDRWRLSDYAVLLNTANLIYLGWDDSGYTAAANPTGDDYYADKDYDDISAIIQIRTANSASKAEIAYSPAGMFAPSIKDRPSESACAFTVAPNQSALIRIASSAGWQNEVEIIDRKAAKVVWRRTDLDENSDRRQAYLICNNSSEVREYFVTGRHKEWGAPDEVKPWVDSACKVLRDESPTLVLGFEDGGGDKDFNDVTIHIRQIPNSVRVTHQDLL